MAFELRLTFSGLTALVPHKEAVDEHAVATEWLVVMPDLKKGEIIKKGNREFSIAPHQAALVVNARAVREGDTTKKPRLRFRNPGTEPKDDQSSLLYPLNREVLEVASGNTGLHVRSTTQVANAPDVNIPDQLHDIKWLPPIDECDDGGVPLDRRFVNPVKPLPTNRLAGVARLDRGVLETADVHRGLGQQPVLYEFRKGSKTGPLRFEQALANTFRLRIPVDGFEASLNLTDRQKNVKVLSVGPYPDCPKNEEGVPYVEVKVVNRELEEILGMGVDPNLPQQGDTDFVIFYRLSPVWANLSADDVALPYRKGGGGGGRSKPCEPPTYPGLGG